MFKKKPQIKNLSPLRSSDRRKLADQIIAEYRIRVPSTTIEPSEASTTDVTAENASPVPALSSIRASLIPENCLSARFTTSTGANAALISGTVYVGAHPGHEERVLWLQYGKEPKPLPTVYTLWQNPGLVPLVHTQDFVVEKLQSGADLMTPGLLGGPPWPEGAKQGSVVAVAGLGKESVPVFVGVCKIDICRLGRVQGTKGAAVEGVHWYGDEIWNWSQNSTGGRPAPARIQGWDAVVNGLAEDVDKLDMDEDDDEQQEDGGVSLDGPASGHKSDYQVHDHTPNHEIEDEEPSQEPTTAEIDRAFQEAFLYALYNAKTNNSPPHYGIDFPIQPSFLISNMIQPHLRHQSPHYTIKKTSWKNVKKFIKHLDKQFLAKSKDRQGGETVILDVDFNDVQLASFIPYKLPKLPKPKPTTTTDAAATPASGSDPSLSQTLALITLYRPSSRLVPDLLPSKTSFYTSSQITASLRQYITSNRTLSENVSSKRNIKLDPFIANNILSSTNPTDKSALASGEIARDVLNRRVLDDANLCIPHYLLLRNEDVTIFNSLDDACSFLSGHKPKAYPLPSVHIILEKRTGSKTVTKISNLESFHINPNILSPELQKKCAGSASVGQLVGGKPGMMEILVQGDQKDVLEKELGRRGVKKEWIEVMDKTKKGKKK